eukprot:gene23286-30522_t
MVDGNAPSVDQPGDGNELDPAGSSPVANAAGVNTEAAAAPDSSEMEVAKTEEEGVEQHGEFVEVKGVVEGDDAADEAEEGGAPAADEGKPPREDYYEEYIEYKPLPAEEVEVAYRHIDVQSEEMEPVVVNEDLTLYKARVPADAVARLTGDDEAGIHDLIPGVYEGGYKLWEGAIDMCAFLCTEYKLGKMLETTDGKRVLELGCGNGLPGITMLMAGANVHFQDYNKEVLKEVSVGNALANLQRLPVGRPRPSMRFFAGDWGLTGQFLTARGFGGHYDIIVVTDSIYDLDSQHHLLECIKQVLQPPHGYVLLASPKAYRGIPGGTEAFRDLVETDGIFEVTTKFTEEHPETGAVREIIKLAFPSSIVPYFL